MINTKLSYKQFSNYLSNSLSFRIVTIDPDTELKFATTKDN